MPLFLTVAFLHPHLNCPSVNFHSTLDIINGEQVIWNLEAMYADKMLDKGKEVIEYEVRNYIKEVLSNFNAR